MGQGSALKHRTIRRLDHQFIRRLHLNHTETRQLNCFSTGWTDAWIEDSAIHPTVIFKSCSTAPSVESSAPDDPTGRRCIALVHCLGFSVQRLYWTLLVIGWSDALQGETIGSSDGTTFSGEFFQRLATLARPINMTPLPLLSCLYHSEDPLQQRREGECVLAIWNSLPLVWGHLS
jgi:hypothetical protein